MSVNVKRIEEICNEFDDRLESVGMAFARLELAKAMADLEALFDANNSESTYQRGLNDGRREGFVLGAKHQSDHHYKTKGWLLFDSAVEDEANRRWPKETP